MANPATKDTLESSHFLSFSTAVQTRLLGCLRSDGGNIRPFSASSEAIEAIKQGLNRVQPKNPGMKRITDAQNSSGQSMVDAVLAYKSLNGIIRAGQPLDNIVGRGTLARLDTELKNGGSGPGFEPIFPENGSTRWRFNFFFNKGVFGKGIFQLTLASTEIQDVGNFDVREIFSNGGLASGFRDASLVSCHVKNEGISRRHRCAPRGAKCSSCRGMCKFCNDAVRSEGK